jgi:hypothetical protein
VIETARNNNKINSTKRTGLCCSAYRLVKEQQAALKDKQPGSKQKPQEEPPEEKTTGGGGLGGFGSLGDLGEKMGHFGGDIISKYLGYVWKQDNREVVYTEEDLGEIREALGVLQGAKGNIYIIQFFNT